MSEAQHIRQAAYLGALDAHREVNGQLVDELRQTIARLTAQRDALAAACEAWIEEDSDESRRMGSGGPDAPWYVHISMPTRRKIAEALAAARGEAEERDE